MLWSKRLVPATAPASIGWSVIKIQPFMIAPAALRQLEHLAADQASDTSGTDRVRADRCSTAAPGSKRMGPARGGHLAAPRRWHRGRSPDLVDLPRRRRRGQARRHQRSTTRSNTSSSAWLGDLRPRRAVLPADERALPDDDKGVVTRYAAVHIGIAATPDGLVVPVVHHAESRDLWATRRRARPPGRRPRGRASATREELSGSTIAMSPTSAPWAASSPRRGDTTRRRSRSSA